MKLDRDQLRTLSLLLEEALDCSPAERAAWLDQLGREYESLKPLLVKMLAASDGNETAELIDTLPRFEFARDAGVAHAPDETVGAYRLLRLLGQGGMAEVWLAERSDGLLQRHVALKLPIIVGARRTLVDRYHRECQILARLAHQNIARLYDVGFTAGGEPFLALEFVEGTPITTYCDDHRLGTRARLTLFLQVLAAVQYAHANLVLHRDLKPSNILVNAAGEVKLLDFGIAKLISEGNAQETEITRLGGRALTIDYASPEQVMGSPLTTGSDVYSLGVLLYELLAGARPYRLKRGTRGELEEAILEAQIVRPSVVAAQSDRATHRSTTAKALSAALSGDLDSIVLKALQRRVESRYPTAAALNDDLQRYLDGRAVLAQPESRWYRTRKLVVRNKLATGAVVSVIAALAIGLAATLWQAGIAREQARVAEREAKTSDAVAAFLVGLFKPIDLRANSLAAVKQMTAEQLLDIGYERSKTELKDAPEIRSRLLAQLSEVYKTHDRVDKAVETARDRIALLTRIGANPIEIANAYKQLASWELAWDRETEATDHLQTGLKAIAGLESEEARRERGNMYQLLGEIAYGRDLDQAQKYYQQAVDLLSEHPVPEDEYPNALNGLAYTRTQHGDVAGGLQALAQMRTERIKRWGADSVMVDIVDNLTTGLHLMAGQISAADALNARNVASMEAKMPALDFSLLNSKSLRGRILLAQERIPEAIDSMQQVLALIRSKQSDEATITSALLIQLSVAYLDGGDALRARQIGDEALAFVEKRAPESGRHTLILSQQGRLRMLEGRFDEARALLTKARAQTADVTPFQMDLPARIIVRLADVSAAEGKDNEAAALLDQADAVLGTTTPWLGYTKDLIASRRAALEIERGRFAAGLTLAETTLAQQARRTEPNQKHALQADLEVLAGRALIGLGKPGEATMHLQNALALRQPMALPGSLWLAETYMYIGQCEPRGAATDNARKLFAQAAAIYAAQTPFDSLYARPLQMARASLAP